MRSEGNVSLKNPVTLLGIDPGTVRIVAQPLNHYATPGPSKKNGLEVSADKTKYMAMSRNQNAGRSHHIKNDNRSFERVEDFKYLRES